MKLGFIIKVGCKKRNALCKWHFLAFLLSFASSFAVYSQEMPVFVRVVYNQMYDAMSNGNVIKPAIILDHSPSQIVTYHPAKNELVIGVKFIELCRSFGKDSTNALAHVLGHELAHILLQQHDFVKTVGSGYASKEVNKQMKHLHKTLMDSVFERQADEYASFYAHVAGYNTVQIGEKVLDSIYIHFNLKDRDLSRYPTLNERKLICRATAERMNVLKLLFDCANLATIAGHYDIAEAAYQAIIKEKFPSREIFNNLSAVYLLKAIQELDTVEFPYVLPVEIDFQSRLYATERSIFSEYDENLNEAIRYAELALGTRKDYSKAWLNKAIAEFLLNKIVDAQYSLYKLQELLDPFTQENGRVLEALIAHKNGDFVRSQQLLGQFAGNLCAERNNEKLFGVKSNSSFESIFTNVERYFKKDHVPKVNSSAFVSVPDMLREKLIYAKHIQLKQIDYDDFSAFLVKDNYSTSKKFVIFHELKQIPAELRTLQLYDSQNKGAKGFTNGRLRRWENYVFEMDGNHVRKIYIF